MTTQAKNFMHILTCNSYKDGEHFRSVLEIVQKLSSTDDGCRL